MQVNLPSPRARLNISFRLLVVVWFLAAVPVRSQVAINTITTTTNTSARNTTEGGTNPGTITFQNDIRAVTSFNAGGMDYFIQSTASNAYIRRNTGAGNVNGSHIWERYSGSANRVVGTDVDNLATMLLDNNLNQGGINLFSNGTAAASWESNIERLDFVWSSGVSVLASDGFAVFDLNGTQEGFQLALITGLGSGLGSPTTWTFTNALEITAGNYGPALDLDNNGSADSFDFRVLRYNNGDNISSHTDGAAQFNQSLDGTFIRLSDLGITDGTIIYGYALMAADVTNSGALLANWNNTTNYSTGTDSIIGGLDLAAFNGRLARNVPEPSTYGAILLATAAAIIGLRRRMITSPVRA